MIYNKTKGKTVVENVIVAGGMLQKARGLMFRKDLNGNDAMLLVFENPSENNGIWMFGMRFPIDLIFLDEEWRVIRIHRNIKPLGWRPSSWKVYYPEDKAKYALEMAAGRANGIEHGDVLGF